MKKKIVRICISLITAVFTISSLFVLAGKEEVNAAPGCPAGLVNGDFETPIIASAFIPGVDRYFAVTTFGDWTLESGSIDLSGAGGFWENASGNQSVDLDGLENFPGTIYQDVPVTPGTTYKLRFAVAGNPDRSPTIKTMNVWWEGAIIDSISFDITGKTRANMGYTYHEYTVTASSPLSRLKFESTTSPSGWGPVIDDVSVSCPATTTGLVPCGGTGQPACNLCHIFQLIKNILDVFLFPIIPIIAALLFAIGGFLLFAAAGNPQNLGRAKTIIFATIIGLLIVYGSFLFVGFLLQAMGVAGWTGLGTWWQITCALPITKSEGSIFITGHDPDFHASSAPPENPVGSQNILKVAIAFARNGSTKPLLVVHRDDLSPPPGHGNSIAGLETVENNYVRVNAAGFASAILDPNLWAAIYVPSDFGGLLAQAELDALNARKADILAYLKKGGGLVALAESNGGVGLTPSGGHFAFLPFIVDNATLHSSETGYTVTPFGASLGLTDSDVNGNASHNIFKATGGMSIINVNATGDMMSLAFRGEL